MDRWEAYGMHLAAAIWDIWEASQRHPPWVFPLAYRNRNRLFGLCRVFEKRFQKASGQHVYMLLKHVETILEQI